MRIAEAVEVQIAEDRRVAEFVRERTAVNVGMRVKVTHKPEHDGNYTGASARAVRAALNGRVAVAAYPQDPADGSWWVTVDGDEAPFEADELVPAPKP